MNFICQWVKYLKNWKQNGYFSLRLKPILNPLPAKFGVNKRCAYHQGLCHDTDRCYNLRHAIQDLIDTKVIAPPTRPNITNNPLQNHNFGRGLRINCLISEEEGEEDLFELIYDLPKCFMMTWEELMGMMSTAGYDIWSEDTAKILNYPISTYRGRHLNPNKITQHPHMGGDTSNPCIWRRTT